MYIWTFLVKKKKISNVGLIVHSDRDGSPQFLGHTTGWHTFEEQSYVEMFWYSPFNMTILLDEYDIRSIGLFTFYMYLKVCCTSYIVKSQIQMLKANLNYFLKALTFIIPHCLWSNVLPCYYLYGCKVR